MEKMGGSVGIWENFFKDVGNNRTKPMKMQNAGEVMVVGWVMGGCVRRLDGCVRMLDGCVRMCNERWEEV